MKYEKSYKLMHATDVSMQSIWNRLWENSDFSSLEKSVKEVDYGGVYDYLNDLKEVLITYLHRTDAILEAGCGNGRWILYLNELGYNVWGLDFSMAGLQIIKRQSSSFQLVSGDVFTLPLKSESLNVYLSFGVIEHFEDGPQGALREVYRVLRPGGVAIIYTPMLSQIRQLYYPFRNANKEVRTWWNRFRKNKASYEFYEYKFTGKYLSSLIQEVGLSIELYKPIGLERGLFQAFRILRNSKKDKFPKCNILGQKLVRILQQRNPEFAAYAILLVAKKPQELGK